jgi:methyl-accepting chemotaxis protein
MSIDLGELGTSRELLNALQTNVFLANASFELVFMNDQARQTLSRFEGEIVKALQVRVADLEGATIHRFHSDPEALERILLDPAALPHQTVFAFGEITLRTRINSLRGPRGVLGYVVAWDDFSKTSVLQDAVSSAVEALAASSSRLESLSLSLTAHAEATSIQAETLSVTSEEVSSRVQTVSEGVIGMDANARQIALSSVQASGLARAAVEMAAAADVTISALGGSSADIAKVIRAITSIARQTKLLALNATIEAARAGEAGKGFAAAANEVKEQSKEIAKATDEIGDEIEGVQRDSQRAIEALVKIGEVIREIQALQETITSAAEEQSATRNEIARGLGEAARGTVEIARSISGVAEISRDTSRGAVEVRASAQALSALALDLQQKVRDVSSGGGA